MVRFFFAPIQESVGMSATQAFLFQVTRLPLPVRLMEPIWYLLPVVAQKARFTPLRIMERLGYQILCRRSIGLRSVRQRMAAIWWRWPQTGLFIIQRTWVISGHWPTPRMKIGFRSRLQRMAAFWQPSPREVRFAFRQIPEIHGSRTARSIIQAPLS